VVQAVKNEQKAKEVATAVDAVSEAARNIGSAQEDTSALSGAALQAAAALSSLNGTDGTTTDLQLVVEEEKGVGRESGNRHDRDRQQSESKSFALGNATRCPWFLQRHSFSQFARPCKWNASLRSCFPSICRRFCCLLHKLKICA